MFDAKVAIIVLLDSILFVISELCACLKDLYLFLRHRVLLHAAFSPNFKTSSLLNDLFDNLVFFSKNRRRMRTFPFVRIEEYFKYGSGQEGHAEFLLSHEEFQNHDKVPLLQFKGYFEQLLMEKLRRKKLTTVPLLLNLHLHSQ